MADLVQICNMALALLGQPRITDFDDTTNVNAGYCRSYMDTARDSVLEDHAWPFATKRVLLQLHSETPIYEYDYQYTLPSDFIAVQDLNDSDIEYAIEMDATGAQKVLLCGEGEDLYLRYTFRNQLPGMWSPMFCEALSCKLAIYLCGNLSSGSANKLELMAKFYDIALAKAKRSQGKQGYRPQKDESSWITARNTSTATDTESTA